MQLTKGYVLIKYVIYTKVPVCSKQTLSITVCPYALMRDLHATRLEGGMPKLFFWLSVTREKKYPQVGFLSVWKGERELLILRGVGRRPGRTRGGAQWWDPEDGKPSKCMSESAYLCLLPSVRCRTLLLTCGGACWSSEPSLPCQRQCAASRSPPETARVASRRWRNGDGARSPPDGRLCGLAYQCSASGGRGRGRGGYMSS